MVCQGATSRLEVAQALVDELGLHDSVVVTPVSSDYFAKTYFAPRPDCERLVNRKLALRGLDVMQPWRDALSHYVVRQRIPPRLHHVQTSQRQLSVDQALAVWAWREVGLREVVRTHRCHDHRIVEAKLVHERLSHLKSACGALAHHVVKAPPATFQKEPHVVSEVVCVGRRAQLVIYDVQLPNAIAQLLHKLLDELLVLPGAAAHHPACAAD